jgi:metal-responsive CopG/Arc/MetJ family transcriptional regulator
MAAKPVQISVDENLLRRIDKDPEVRRRGRSAFIRSAVELYLGAKRRRATDRQIEQAYRGRAGEMLDEIADLIDAQEWPRRVARGSHGER